PVPDWQDDTNYRVEVRVVDKAGNLGPSTTFQILGNQFFTWDASGPATGIKYPNQFFTNSIANISGTAQEPHGPNAAINKSLTASVKIAVQDRATLNWWNGTNFGITNADFGLQGGFG